MGQHQNEQLQDAPSPQPPAVQIIEQWMKQIPFLNWDRDVLVTDSNDSGQSVRLLIYTETNCYRIKAENISGQRTYLGCIANSRKSRAGEGHTRGNDLPDGPLNIETWTAILSAIVGYELVKIHRFPKQGGTADISEALFGNQDDGIITTAKSPAPHRG